MSASRRKKDHVSFYYAYFTRALLGRSEGNARGINSASFFFFRVQSQNAVQLQRMREVYAHA